MILEYLWYGVAGLLGGLLGGMGMGGGTLLIPLLSIFYNVSQHTSQAINLISFIPMAVVAIIIHVKNGLVDFKKVMWIIIPGVFTCIVGCYIAKAMSGDLLKRFFGGFLLALSVFQFITGLKREKK